MTQEVTIFSLFSGIDRRLITFIVVLLEFLVLQLMLFGYIVWLNINTILKHSLHKASSVEDGRLRTVHPSTYPCGQRTKIWALIFRPDQDFGPSLWAILKSNSLGIFGNKKLGLIKSYADVFPRNSIYV